MRLDVGKQNYLLCCIKLFCLRMNKESTPTVSKMYKERREKGNLYSHMSMLTPAKLEDILRGL